MSQDIEFDADGNLVVYMGDTSAAYAIAATSDSWAPQSGNPIADIQRLCEEIRKPPPRSPWRRIVEVSPSLLPYRAPRLERERFSGGVNLSAQARNAELVAAAREAQEMCFIQSGEMLACSPRGAAELRAKLRAAELPELEPFQFSFTVKDTESTPPLDLTLAWAAEEKARINRFVDLRATQIIGLPFKLEPV